MENTPQYKKPEELKALEILLGISDEETNITASKVGALKAENVILQSEDVSDDVGESELVVKAREFKAKIDLLWGAMGK